MSNRGRLCALLLTCLAGLPAAVVAQEGAGRSDGRWFPGSLPFAPLRAAPREVELRGSFVLADRPGSDFPGRNVEAEVAIGHRIPVVRLGRRAAGSAEAGLGFEVGIFSRFFMETPEKDLIHSDFRVGAPLALRVDRFEARLTLLHVSSHVGDDFLARFPRPHRQVTRDGVEALAGWRPLPAVRAYLGADLNFHVNPGVERTAARAGIEWEPGGGTAELAAWPFAAVDLQLASGSERVAGTGAAGVAVRVGGLGLRLEARGHFGPSPLGQLRDVDETFFGVGLRVEP